MASKVTTEDVKRIADLCRLTLTHEEVTLFSKLFTETLHYMDMLNELDTTSVSETYQVTDLKNVFQADDSKVGRETLTQGAALSNAGETKNGQFATKAVFDR